MKELKNKAGMLPHADNLRAWEVEKRGVRSSRSPSAKVSTRPAVATSNPGGRDTQREREGPGTTHLPVIPTVGRWTEEA